ncbi:hypothetical protein ACRJ4B_10650 [Streptomyces sp. GTA36]
MSIGVQLVLHQKGKSQSPGCWGRGALTVPIHETAHGQAEDILAQVHQHFSIRQSEADFDELCYIPVGDGAVDV